MHTKLKIKCKIHGVFFQAPHNHLKGQGCPVCGGSQQKTTQQFIKEANNQHNNRYNYSLTTYKNTHAPVIIICNTHGRFEQIASDHLNGCGCPKCSQKHQYTTDEFIEKAKIIHNSKYNYLKTKYINWNTKTIIICPDHGEFNQTPSNHLHKHGCPRCAVLISKNYSKVCIEWLQWIEQNNNIKIQHAKQGGEYIIPNTNLKVDGFHKETNTVYEFYGDVFHGNPKIFNPDDLCHPYDKTITAGKLLEKTTIREQQLIDMGYKIISIWENDWNNKRKK